MPEQDYLQQGVQQAAQARELVSNNWADTWKQYAVNYALNRQSNDDQLNLWNLMNEYNSPANQMKRFKDAGLNPNLVYTQGNPGNASSSAQYTPMTADIHPNSDAQKQISTVLDVVGMVQNLAGNISDLINQGLDLQLKKNQVWQSNFDKSLTQYVFPDSGVPRYKMLGHSIDDALNPLSSNFDPLMFTYFSKNGHMPVYWNQFLSGESTRALQSFKSQYQKYYNENLLPKFNEYQQGKIDLQEIEKMMNNYEYEVTSMLPPEIRGIIEPLVQYLSPFLKFIFKKSQGNFNHKVN